MQILGYKNIPRIIMVTTITLILLNTLLISLVYYKNQYNIYEQNIQSIKLSTIEQQKQTTKNDIKNLIDMINYKYDNNILKIIDNKEEIKKYISRIPYDKNKSNYIFVYELLDKHGGDKFAKMIINPNRPDIAGKYISSNYKDIDGFAFRKKFLADINSVGESIVRYSYKKSQDKIEKKISYFYYFAPLNWIVAKGVYIDDIQLDIENEKKTLKNIIKKQINQNLFLFILFSIIAIFIAYIIGKKIENIITEKDIKVKSTTKALATFNRTLDLKVKKEIEKNKKQQQILMQKAKFASLGEMISIIAHQWRQPISELNAIILNIKLHYDLKKLDNQMMQNKTQEIENLLEYMSNTIEDFRGFFKPNKQQQNFNINDSLNRVFDISKSIIEPLNINIVKKIDQTLQITNYQNELEQVVLNLIINAKDAMIKDQIKNKKITINLYSLNSKTIKLEVCDNAKGIDNSIIDKIFDPYFTTKDESSGTGIGLYMSKMIIEENMNGTLEVKSSLQGSCFCITLHT